MSREELCLAELTGLPRMVLARLRGPLQWVLALIVLSLLPALALAQSTGVNGGGPNGGSSGVSQIVAGTNVTISPPGGTGTVTVNATGGGGGTPATPTKSVQFNNSGAFGGTSNFLWDNTNDVLSIGGTSGGILDSLTGQNLSLLGGNALIDATEAAVTIGTNGATGAGGILTLNAGNAVTSGVGGPAQLNAGNATGTNQGGGPVTISAGTSTGSATQGTISFVTHGSNRFSIFETGDWALAGAPGSSGNVVSSNGAGSPPTWKSLSSILSCAANQIAYDNASAQLTCSPLLSYTDSTSVLQLGTIASGLQSQFLFAEGTSPNADTHVTGMWTDNLATYFAAVPDNLAVSTSGAFLAMWRNELSAADVCQFGATVAPYLPCRVTLGTNGATVTGAFTGHGTQLILGPLNVPSTGGDIGMRFRCFDNDSCAFLARAHLSGSNAYAWTEFTSGTVGIDLVGTNTEHIPSTTTTPNLAQRMPHLTGASAGSVSGTIAAASTTFTLSAGSVSVGQTLVFPGTTPTAYLVLFNIGGGQYRLSHACNANCASITGTAYNEIAPGYEGWITSPGNFIWQLSDGGQSTDLGGNIWGTTFFQATKDLNTPDAHITIGDNTNSSSTTNIVGPTAANTKANNAPIVTAAGTYTAGDCAVIASSNFQVQDQGNPCAIFTTYAAIGNVATLSGAQTITFPDGTTGTAATGSTVLLTAQTTQSQNGPYLIPSGGGAWVSLGPLFGVGNIIPQYAVVLSRDLQTGTSYLLQTIPGAITVGTTAQIWQAQMAFLGNVASLLAGPITNTLGVGGPFTAGGGSSTTASGTGTGGTAIWRGGNGSPTTSSGAAGGPSSVQGGKGGSTAGNGKGGDAFALGGPGSTTTSGNSAGGDAYTRPGLKGSGTGANGNSRVEDANAKTWVLVNDAVGSNFPPQTANGGITCNSASKGSFLSVSDASSPAIGSAYVSGGSSSALIACDGSSWIVVAGSPTKFPAHLAYAGSAPAVSACGTSPAIDANATDASGTVTVGTVAAASCTVTFSVAYTTFNHCRVTSQSTIASFAYSYTLSAITVTGTSLVGDKFDYNCDGT